MWHITGLLCKLHRHSYCSRGPAQLSLIFSTRRQEEPEYYAVGRDDLCSLVPTELVVNSPTDVAVLACGIGDARNLLMSLMVTGTAHKALAGKRNTPYKGLHFTLVDLKPAVFARILVVFRLLLDADTGSQTEKDETLAAVCYVFVAQVMPKWASDKLQAAISSLLVELEDSSRAPMDLFYIHPEARARITHVLRQWQQPPQPWYTAGALRFATMRSVPMAEFDDRSNVKLPPGWDADVALFESLYILVPSKELLQRHEPQLSSLLDAKPRQQIDRGAVEEYLDSAWQPNLTLIDVDFETSRYDGPKPNMSWSVPDIIHQFFRNAPLHTFGGEKTRGILGPFCEFFRTVGERVGLTRQARPVVIEIIIGEMTATLTKLRHGVLRDDQKPIGRMDPETFPNLFDNIDLSNIPDYVGGSLTTFLHAVPNLRTPASSRIRSYVMRNPNAWDSHDEFLAEYLLLATRKEIKSHFRTALRPASLQLEQKHSAMPLPGMPGGMFLMFGMEWERTASTIEPLAPETRMTRGELERWLHSHFLKLCLPYPREEFSTGLVYAPLSMMTFFHIVAHAAALGYPPHWLSGTLAALCSGALTNTRAGPPRAVVTNGAMAKKALPPAQVSIASFVAEFRTLLALWEPVLGVPVILEASPSLLPERSSIRRFSITFPPVPRSVDYWLNPNYALVFKARSLAIPDAEDLWRLLSERDASADRATTAPGETSVHVVSAYHWKTNARTANFWMDKGVMDDLIAKGDWEAWIWRTDSWKPIIGPVSLDEEGAVIELGAWC
jgi:hypothetical protein